MTRAWVASLILAISLAAIMACGGDDAPGPSGPGPSAPAGTKASPTPPPAPGDTAEPGAPPEPPDPEIDEAAEILADGYFKPIVQSALPLPWDVTAIPLIRNQPAPPCDQFVVSFGWQVTIPNPPAGTETGFELVRDGGNVLIGRGTSGTAQTGCGVLNIINYGQGGSEVTIHYKVGRVP